MIGQDITILSSDWLSRQLQLNTTFHHELKDPLSQMVFRNVFRSAPCIYVSLILTVRSQLGAWPGHVEPGARGRGGGRARAGPVLLVAAQDGAARRAPGTVLYCTVLYYTVLHQDQARENLNFFLGSMSGVIYYLNENGSCMEVPRL